MSDLDYKQINRDLWNARTDEHYTSEFYDNESFIKGKSSLNSIELDLLGDVKGKKILHLQCHFGQDSISLARMGAEVTGVDLSDASIQKANELANLTGTDAHCNFVRSDVYDLPEVLDDSFDIVFTSYGTIGWLPDLDKWASVISHFLKPEGRFVFAEFHPVVWMFDNDFKTVAYNYFNDGPIVEVEEGTYTNQDADINHQSVGWNHAIGEVVTSLLNHNMTIKALQEFDYSPYACFAVGKEIAPGKHRIPHLDNKLPMVYALEARMDS